MVVESSYDFLPGNYVSFPSSLKIVNTAEKTGRYTVSDQIPVIGNSVYATINAKGNDILISPTSLRIQYYDGTTWKQIRGEEFPMGNFDWREFQTQPTPIPPEAQYLRARLWPAKGTIRLDDLQVYQDGVLIYENNFTAPIVQVAVSVVLPIVTGLGVVRFGKKG